MAEKVDIHQMAGFADAPAVDFVFFAASICGAKWWASFSSSLTFDRVQHREVVADGFIRGISVKMFGTVIPEK